MHKALSLPGFYPINEENNEDSPSFCTHHPSCKYLITFAHLLALRAQVSLDNGDTESAVSDIMKMFVLGQKILTSNEGFDEYFIGRCIEDIALSKMCDMIAFNLITMSDIVKFVSLVADSEAKATISRERVLKGEYASRVRAIEWFFDVTCGNRDQKPDWVRNIIPWYVRWPGFAKFAIHRRESLDALLALARKGLKKIFKICSPKKA